MATTEQLMELYGVAWFGFDEEDGNVIDKLGNNYTGTVTKATRVEGWNGEGKAMNFDRIAKSYITFNDKIVPTGDVTIRMKIKFNSKPSSENQEIISCSYATATNSGIRVWLDKTDKLVFTWTHKTDGEYSFSLEDNVEYNNWQDYMLSWDTINNIVKLYKNDSLVGETVSISNNSKTPTYNLTIGKQADNTYERYFDGQIDDLQIYNKVLSPSDFTQKRLAFKTTDNKHIVLLDDKIREIPDLNEDTLLTYARVIRDIDSAVDRSLDLTTFYTQYETISIDGTSNIKTIDETSAKDLLGETPQVVYYTESDASQIVVETEVEPFSVYDYISETPQVIVYTESTEDITVSTTTEPFDIYDEFGDSVEVLYYTDDTEATNANLIVEANWSPIDELEGDFEIVTWTDEPQETAKRTLGINAIPKPQLIKFANTKEIAGYFKQVSSIVQGEEYVRFFISPDGESYFVWNKSEQQFKSVTISNEKDILKFGMTSSDLNEISESQWLNWKQDFNVCVFLKDDIRDRIVSSLDKLSYSILSPIDTSSISSSSLYILNTTAKINVELKGNTLIGHVSDDDLTRVQYRVLLNDKNYYPKDGSFTALSRPPQNINLEIPTKDIIIGGVNTVKVEFQDFFGTVDYWLTQFVGEYSGVMFADEQNKYYSSDAGEILRSLDFGTIIAGQTSRAKPVYIQNKHSFDIHNIALSKMSGTLPEGVELQISKTENPFIPEDKLLFEDLLSYNEKFAFYVRLQTAKSSPPGFGDFDINVKADPVKVDPVK